jgi:hydroxylamine reductase
MFCFQCEQAVPDKGCTLVGTCGKKATTSNLQDELTGALVGLARATEGTDRLLSTDALMMEGLFLTVTNVNFDDEDHTALIDRVHIEKSMYGSGCGSGGCGGCSGCGSVGGETEDEGEADASTEFDESADLPPEVLFTGDMDQVSLRTLLLTGLRGMAAYGWHAHVLGYHDEAVSDWFFKGMRAIGEYHEVEEWLDLLMEFGKINYRCMELLDEANTVSYGHPVPTPVTMTIERGPFIVVSGHDLHDLKQLLEQTDGKGVAVYTHGEMLPAHSYPELKKHSQLKGNFGTAWQNQRKEFDKVPGAFLFTTNCLMAPRDSYKDRVFTTAMVGFPGLVHIPSVRGRKNFTPVIEKALALGGWPEDNLSMKGINGGSTLLTGFGHHTVLGVADKVIDAVKSGALKRIFLVGGCDGAKPGRNYYTEFVQRTPSDSVVLTLACGKFRFNDLDLGSVGGLPRIMDMGQCNDSYSAIKVAIALSEAFGIGINDLPLTLVLSWYEQKAVCVLLTLLSLGVKNILLGPTLPQFVSPAVLDVLVQQYGVKPISTPEKDLVEILAK